MSISSVPTEIESIIGNFWEMLTFLVHQMIVPSVRHRMSKNQHRDFRTRLADAPEMRDGFGSDRDKVDA